MSGSTAGTIFGAGTNALAMPGITGAPTTNALAPPQPANTAPWQFDPNAAQWMMNNQQAGGFNPQSLFNPQTAGGLYASGYTNPGAGLADLIAQQQGMLNVPMQAQQPTGTPGTVAGPAMMQPAQGGVPGQQWQAPIGPNDVMAQALGVPTQQQAMQTADPRQYGQPGNAAMWTAVQGLLGANAGGGGGRG